MKKKLDLLRVDHRYLTNVNADLTDGPGMVLKSSTSCRLYNIIRNSIFMHV